MLSAGAVLTVPWNSIPAWRLANYGALSSCSMIMTTNKTIMLYLRLRALREKGGGGVLLTCAQLEVT